MSCANRATAAAWRAARSSRMSSARNRPASTPQDSDTYCSARWRDWSSRCAMYENVSTADSANAIPALPSLTVMPAPATTSRTFSAMLGSACRNARGPNWLQEGKNDPAERGEDHEAQRVSDDRCRQHGEIETRRILAVRCDRVRGQRSRNRGNHGRGKVEQDHRPEPCPQPNGRGDLREHRDSRRRASAQEHRCKREHDERRGDGEPVRLSDYQ